MSNFRIININEVNNLDPKFLSTKKTDFAADGWCARYKNGVCYWIDNERQNIMRGACYYDGKIDNQELLFEEDGVRPVFEYDPKQVSVIEKVIDGQLFNTIEYGVYPQDGVSNEETTFLNKLKEDGKLIETGQSFTIHKEASVSAWGEPYPEHKLPVYEIFGHKYVYFNEIGWYEL